MVWHIFLHFECLESQIRQQLTKLKRQIFIGQRPFDSRLYLDISRSFKWKESFIFRYFKWKEVRYIIIETKEFARIGYNGFLFLHSYSGDGLGATHLGLHLSTHEREDNIKVVTLMKTWSKRL
jgi:hypothetical protein